MRIWMAFWGVMLGGLAAQADGVNQKVHGDLDVGQYIDNFALTPDGNWIVWVLRTEGEKPDELYSRPVDLSGSPTLLSNIPDASHSVFDFIFTPNSERVLFRTAAPDSNAYDIYAHNVDGVGAPVKINGAHFSFPGNLNWVVSPDSRRVLYMASALSPIQYQLYIASVDAPNTAQQVNQSMSADPTRPYGFSADSEYVLYITRLFLSSPSVLYSRKADLSEAQQALHTEPGSGGTAGDFQIPPNGNRVVFTALLNPPGGFNLYSVPIDGSEAETLLHPMLPSGRINQIYTVSPDGQWVAFVSDRDVDDLYELYSVPVDGSTGPIRLNKPYIDFLGDVVGDFLAISSDSQRVVYVSNETTPGLLEWHSALLDGSAPSAALGITASVRELWEFARIAPDGKSVFARSDVLSDNAYELVRAPIEGGGPVEAISAPSPNDTIADFTVSDNSSAAFYRAIEEEGITAPVELFRRTLDQGFELERVNGPLEDTELRRQVFDYVVGPAGDVVVYLADQDKPGVKELYVTYFDGAIGPPSEHSADQNGDSTISLSELLRVIQFFNSAGLHCAASPGATEDGFVPGVNGAAQSCTPHASDYNPQDWVISLSELLRLIQFFNSGGYFACESGEDGYCPSAP